MRLKRKDLRKLIIETLLKEASAQNVTDKSGNSFLISSEGDITLVKNGKKTSFEGEQKRKVALNLIDDLKSMNKPIPSGLIKRAPDPDFIDLNYEIVDEDLYRFKILPDGKLFLLSKSGKLINKEITEPNKSKAVKVLQDLVKDKKKSYPYLFKISTSSVDQAGSSASSRPGNDQKTGIQYYPGYNGKILTNNIANIKPSKDEDMIVGACETDGCAQFVRETLGPHVGNYVGNAWHAHGRFAKESAFNSLTPDQQAEAAKLFSAINANPKEKAYEGPARAFVKSLIPDQSQFRNLALGDVVGLYYNPSDNFTKAFFEGATGHQSMGKESKVSNGPFFLTDTGEPWSPVLLGQKIKFKPGKTLEGGKGFGMNTHIGFVGAMVDGVPIIYHNVHHVVKATGLEAMSKRGLSIVWAGRLAKS